MEHFYWALMDEKVQEMSGEIAKETKKLFEEYVQKLLVLTNRGGQIKIAPTTVPAI